MRPLVVGNYEKPRCFKNVRSFPCDYSAHKKAWMTGDLFTAWLHELDKKMEAENRKILLFIDNCPSHPRGVELKKVKVEFLPKNSSGVLQPLNQGIIKVMKQKYRKLIVQRYLCISDQPHFNSSDIKMNVLDAMHYVVSSWNEVKAETIVNCFHKVGFVNQPIKVSGRQESDDEGWTELQARINQPGNFENFVEVDDGMVTSELLTIEDMIQSKGANSDTEEEDMAPPQSVKKSEALEAIETLRRFFSAKTGVDDAIFLRLSYLEHAVIASGPAPMQQTTIDDFLISILKLSYNNDPSANKN
ncbi:hypothetical protein J437_LFUL011936 [Ladona fulva]|uniref:DDE-1 domain-containing protein n=1 Tax=Ladona fulva TaxID=123851 RepID=A0A8K0NYQ2_LADFU|nr:hypothetical protein J437_LFUL011936 [Ladona fulva]